MVAVILPGEVAHPEGTPRNETDPEFLARLKHAVLLWVPLHEGILGLNRAHRLHCVSPADGRGARLRKAEVQHLALSDQLFDRAGDVLDRDVRVDAMLVQQIDTVGAEALERAIDDCLDVLGAAVQTTSASFDVEAELRRDPDAVANWRERFTDKLLAGVGPVHFGGIEERHASLMRFAENFDAFASVCRRSVVGADAHGASADFRDLQCAELSCLHLV